MALKNIAAFNWDKLLSKVESADVKRTLNLLRNKSNDILAASAKYGAATDKIDFQTYQKKLRFTSSAVEKLEAAYKTRKLPQYHATLPAFEAKKRDLALQAVDRIVAAASEDLNELKSQLEAMEKVKITKDSTYRDLAARFPKFGGEVEQEISTHSWGK